MKRTLTITSLLCAATLMSGCGGGGGPSATILADILTSFEPGEYALGSSDFALGTAPDSVDFSGGLTLTVGQGHLYKTGIASWRISGAASVGLADLDNPASVVELYAANQSAGQGVVKVFDESDVLIATVNVTVTDMMDAGARMVFIAADLGAAGIGKIEVTNSSGDSTWIDDFGVTYP